MINEARATDEEALWVVKEALNDLILRFTLAGLSLLGEAVEVVERKGVGTLCTDGRRIYYDPEWMKKIWAEKHPIYATYDILHEWLHVFYNHPLRCGDRDGRVWNESCDIFVVMEVSLILGVVAPSDGVQPQPWAKGMTVEEIYDYLMQRPGQQQSEEGAEPTDFLYLEAKNIPPDTDAKFREQFTEEVQSAVAITTQMQQGDVEWSEATKKRLTELTKPHVPWGRLLRGDLLTQMGSDQYTYARLNRKYLPHVILPTPYSYRERTLLILVDVSASVGKTLLSAFANNIAPAAARAQETIIITFDAVIREEIRTRRPKQVLKELQFATGDHTSTDIRPCFERADRINPSACVAFTDGWIYLPERPRPKTLWVLPENGREQPWGRNYHMKITW